MNGCTTSSDDQYVNPNDVKLDDAIRAAREVSHVLLHNNSLDWERQQRSSSAGRCVELIRLLAKLVCNSCKQATLVQQSKKSITCCDAYVHISKSMSAIAQVRAA